MTTGTDSLATFSTICPLRRRPMAGFVRLAGGWRADRNSYRPERCSLYREPGNCQRRGKHRTRERQQYRAAQPDRQPKYGPQNREPLVQYRSASPFRQHSRSAAIRVTLSSGHALLIWTLPYRKIGLCGNRSICNFVWTRTTRSIIRTSPCRAGFSERRISPSSRVPSIREKCSSR